MRSSILAALLTSLILLATPAPSLASYNHLAACKATLRGHYGSDDDIHRFGVTYGATSFAGWGTYWHARDGSVYVYGIFNGGSFRYGLGHCWRGDYGPDSMG